MNINWDLFLKIVMPIVTLILGAILKHLFESREKLIAHYGHVSSFKMKNEPPAQDSWVHTHSVVVRNTGRKSATNVRLGHSVLPPNVVVQPDIEYSIKELPGGGRELVFPTLTPKKEITISYLYFPPLTYNQINSHVESDSGPAKVVNVLLQPIPPKWLTIFLYVLVFFGLVGFIYSMALLAMWLLKI